MPDPIRPERRVPPPDDEIDPSLLTALRPSADRMKNFRLIGTGLNPFIVYGSALLFVACWFFGAYLLSIFGPLFAIVITAGLFATSLALSRKETRAEARMNMGLCPKCGYDLRASNDRCPECGTPIPEPILRWRRLRPPIEPGMPGYVEPAVKPPIPPPDNS
jgi:hypothetical protein